MTETQSYPFDLIRSPLAKKKYNLSYSDSDFNGGANWTVLVSSDCPDNVDDCLNSSSELKSGVNTTSLGDIKLELVEYSDYSSSIIIKENVTFTLDDDLDVKGVFLKKKSSNFILAYSINLKPMRFCEKIIFEADNVLWNIIG